MADNTHTLNTRIKLKYDTYQNWITNDPVLLAGEVAIATVEANNAEGKPGFQNLPNVVIKVGDGTSKYSALKFVSALAADVHSWAKNDIDWLNSYIDGRSTNLDTDTQYTIAKVNDYQYKLQSKAKGEASFSDTGVLIDLPNDTAAIEALQNKFTGMTEATVVAHVAAEIAKLNIADYAKKTEVQAVNTALENYKTSNDGVIAAIKDHAAVDSFNDVMVEMAKHATKEEAKGYADAKDEAIKAAKDAADAAQGDVDELTERVEANETHATTYGTKVDTLVGEDADKSVRTIAAEEAAKKDQAIADALKAGQDAQADADALELDMGDVDGLSTENKTVVGAINEVLAAVGTGGTAAVVTITTDTTTEGALKSYTVKQGTTTVGVIDIPKDMVVQSGSVVVDPEGQPAGTYIKLVLANATNDEIFVNVGTLVDIYKAQANATQVQLTIDSTTREISAAIVAGSVTATELADNAVVTAKIADGNVTKAKLSTAVQASLDKADASATQTDMDAAEGRLDAIEAKLADSGDGTVASKIAAAEQAAKDYADDQIEALGIDNYLKKADAPGYADILTKTEAQTTYAPISHEHEIAHVKGLQDALDWFY